MKQLARYLTLGCLWVGLVLHGQTPQTKGQDPDIQKNNSMIALMRKAGRPIAFYGKVVDQFNNPVEGADVIINVEAFRFNPVAFLATNIQDIKLKTNKNGEFSYKKKKGMKVFVDKISHVGYEYDLIRAVKDKSLSADYTEGQIPKASNPATPAIFHMRKLGEQTFLFTDDFHLSFGEKTGFERGYDVIRHEPVEGECLKTGQFLGTPIVPDLKVKALWNEKEQTWTLELSAGTPGGGLLVADHKLYEAPAEGYQPSYTFKVRLAKNFNQKRPTVILPGNPPKEVQLTRESPEPDNQVLHLYLRTREPWIYTRIECPFPSDAGVASPDHIALRRGVMDSRNLAVNPYGERNLEEAQDLPGAVVNKLWEEVCESYRYHPNGRPPKPDLVKLTQEWKKQQSAGEKAKGLFR